MISCISNSQEEAYAILKKRLKSLLVFRPAPSAMFDPIDATHLRS